MSHPTVLPPLSNESSKNYFKSVFEDFWEAPAFTIEEKAMIKRTADSANGTDVLLNLGLRTNAMIKHYAKNLYDTNVKVVGLTVMREWNAALLMVGHGLRTCQSALKSSIRLINFTTLSLGIGTTFAMLGFGGIVYSSRLQEKIIAELENGSVDATKSAAIAKTKMKLAMIRNISNGIALSGLALTVATTIHLWMAGRAYESVLSDVRLDTHCVRIGIKN